MSCKEKILCNLIFFLEVFFNDLKIFVLQDGKNAAALNVAHKYVEAFYQLAQKGNTLILPSNVGDVPSAVAQAMTIYQKLAQAPTLQNESSYNDENLKQFEIPPNTSSTSASSSNSQSSSSEV